jgi:hypothetical protein
VNEKQEEIERDVGCGSAEKKNPDADREPCGLGKKRSRHLQTPDGLRLSGEGSGAERVRCRALFGDEWFKSP